MRAVLSTAWQWMVGLSLNRLLHVITVIALMVTRNTHTIVPQFESPYANSKRRQ